MSGVKEATSRMKMDKNNKITMHLDLLDTFHQNQFLKVKDIGLLEELIMKENELTISVY
jgi:hypothetical protein